METGKQGSEIKNDERRRGGLGLGSLDYMVGGGRSKVVTDSENRLK